MAEPSLASVLILMTPMLLETMSQREDNHQDADKREKKREEKAEIREKDRRWVKFIDKISVMK